MKLNQLDKATKLYKSIQEIDTEILKIEKRAIELANGNYEVSASFTFKNLDPKAKKVRIDEDGSLCTGDEKPSVGFTFFFGSSPIKAEDAKDKYEIVIDEKATLYMLGALLQLKQAQRKELIDKIKKLGFVTN